MKIKKYLASDMKEGLLRVKKDLGPDAIIIQSRKVRRRGLRGFFSPRQTEIVAAFEPGEKEPPFNGMMLKKVMEKERELSSMAEELKTLKATVSELSTVATINDGEEPAGKLITRKKSSAYWRSYLEHHDLDPTLLVDIFSEAEEEAAVPGRMSHGRMAEILRDKLERRLCRATDSFARNQVFIGPTGVGKTTTLAKLAARYALDRGEKVGMVTIDHYRVGAIDQLRSYAEIMDLPLEVVMAPPDLFKVMVRLQGCDRILVDTAGRSTGSEEQLADLSTYVEMLLPADIHLVISATTRRQDVQYITERFKRLRYNRLIITKIDETTAYGAVLNSAYYTGLPLAYLTDGQRVPEDIKAAGELDLAGLFWRSA